MPINLQVTEKELKRVFKDTLDKGASRAGIFVAYRDSEWERFEVGVPYTINEGVLVIGPYFKNILTGTPRDFDARKKPIPISNIIHYKRLELSDLT